MQGLAVALDNSEIVLALADENVTVDFAGIMVTDFGLAVEGNWNLGASVRWIE